LSVLFALPSIVWVAWYSGIPRYLEIVIASVRAEGRRLKEWPAVDFTAPFTEPTLTAFNYYAFWALPLVAAAVLVWRAMNDRDRARPDRDRDVGFGIVLIVLALMVNLFFLRANLQARFGDAAVPVSLVAAWLAGTASSAASPMRRWLVPAGMSLLLALMIAAFVVVNSLAHEFETGGLSVSLDQTRLRFHEVIRTLRALPSTSAQDREGPLAVSRYLSTCTAPEDRVLVGLYGNEIPYFARRLFAAGQGTFTSGFLRSDADQRLALDRLSRQSVPIVITAFDYQGEIAANYPLVAHHLSSRYREVGVIPAGGQPYVRVFVDIMRPPRGTDPASGFPCFR